MFLIVVLTVLWIIHGYVAWKVIPTLGLTSSGGITAYILVFFLSILPLLPILLRYSGSETKIIDRISLFGYTSLGFFFNSIPKNIEIVIKNGYNNMAMEPPPLMDFTHPERAQR